MKIKKRLDVLLTERGHADSRTKAQAIIMSGHLVEEEPYGDRNDDYDDTFCVNGS